MASAALLSPNVVGAQISNAVLDRQHDQAVAVAYGGAPGAMEKAVLLHGQVVHQRMAHDSRRFECLRSHANLLYYYGRLEGARQIRARIEGRDSPEATIVQRRRSIPWEA